MIKFNETIENIKNSIGLESTIIIKEIYLGTIEPMDAAIIYINDIVNKNIIDRDILKPLMFGVVENLHKVENASQYLCKKYIPVSTSITRVYEDTISSIKEGNTLLIMDGICEFIIINTSGGKYRQISEPINETAIRGSREGFVENIDTNISILRRIIKDKNLSVEDFTIGRRSETRLSMVYIRDIADKTILEKITKKIAKIDVDYVTATGVIEQLIETNTYSLFPQTYGTERPDIVVSYLMEGRVAIILNGTPFVLTAPSLFTQFFHGVEDYYERTVVANFTRLLRFSSILVVVFLPAIYITLIKFNAELIPIKFITPIIQSRVGIPLTPVLEILTMELIIEFLREGGLRLPSKIAPTLSVVGGIIIGDAAVKSKFVSPTALLITGIVVVASFVIPKYDMALSIRLLRFPMIILANALGILGIAAGCYFIIVHLCTLESFGVPYLPMHKGDQKDTFIRVPMWKMNKRPATIPNNDKIRQSDFKYDGEDSENENE